MAVVAVFLAFVLWQLYLSQFDDYGYDEDISEELMVQVEAKD